MRSVCMILVLALLGLAASGCGGDDEETTTTPIGATGTTGATGATGAAGAGEAEAATDTEAMEAARNAQVAIEAYGTDNVGSYEGADLVTLKELEPSLPGDLTVEADDSSYEITVPSQSGNAFTITRDRDGSIEQTCIEPGTGECPADGEW